MRKAGPELLPFGEKILLPYGRQVQRFHRGVPPIFILNSRLLSIFNKKYATKPLFYTPFLFKINYFYNKNSYFFIGTALDPLPFLLLLWRPVPELLDPPRCRREELFVLVWFSFSTPCFAFRGTRTEKSNKRLPVR